MQPTMNRTQAAERIENHIESTLRQLPDGATLRPMGKTDNLPCDAPDDGGPPGRVIVEHQYAVEGLSPETYPQQFDTVQRYWESQGYEQLAYQKRGKRWVMIYQDAEGFRLRIATSVDGSQITIRSQSPCIWPDGTPAPEQR